MADDGNTIGRKFYYEIARRMDLPDLLGDYSTDLPLTVMVEGESVINPVIIKDIVHRYFIGPLLPEYDRWVAYMMSPEYLRTLDGASTTAAERGGKRGKP